MGDAFLFEFGVFDFDPTWGPTFEVDFVRQLELRNHELQQVHLVVHYRASVWKGLRRRIGAQRCTGPLCSSRCSFVGDSFDLLGTPCTIVERRTPDPLGRTRSIDNAHIWSYDSGGESPAAQHRAWLDLVEQSPVLRYLVDSGVKPLGYEVWRDAVD